MSASSPSIKLFAVLASAALLCACSTPSQVYWDNKVKEMCEKDGGVTVYETVELTKEEMNKLDIKNVSHSTEQDLYYEDFQIEIIESGNPEVYKTIQYVYRNSDKKLLGKKTSYGRRGGDIPDGVSHPSSYSCNQVSGFSPLFDKVFTMKGD